MAENTTMEHHDHGTSNIWDTIRSRDKRAVLHCHPLMGHMIYRELSNAEHVLTNGRSSEFCTATPHPVVILYFGKNVRYLGKLCLFTPTHQMQKKTSKKILFVYLLQMSESYKFWNQYWIRHLLSAWSWNLRT